MAGETFIQKDLARTLKKIAEEGPGEFYKGTIASTVAQASAANGGILSREDLAAYAIADGPVLSCSYRSLLIMSAPPPSSGGTALCEILNILEGYDLAAMGYHSAAAVHAMVEAMRHAFVDRNFLLGDPDFVRNPVDRLISKEYAAAIRSKIEDAKATPSVNVQTGVPPHEGTETTHYSIIDMDGNAASVTYTVNAYFGAKVIAGDTGFFLNDEMDDFTTKPGVPNMFGLVQGKQNMIEPSKRPLSSMSPTIVMRDGKVMLVTGSPGGSRIITTVLEVILNITDFGMNIQEAVDAPRIHHQWMPDQIFAEPFALSSDSRRALEAMGYKIVEQTPWGAAESIAVNDNSKDGAGKPSSTSDSMVKSSERGPVLLGGHDDRRPAGSVAGY
jgi:gamma-glutamyltranspeptidase/glutathione hydrolase